MEEIISEFGSAFIAAISVIAIIGILAVLIFGCDSSLSQYIIDFVNQIC